MKIRPLNKNQLSYYLDGNDTVIGMVHGFTSNPMELRWLAGQLNQAGYSVDARLLPFHGSDIHEINLAHCEEWLDFILNWHDDLQANYQSVVFLGFSLGSMLTLYLAAQRPAVRGIILLATAMTFGNIRNYEKIKATDPRDIIPKKEIFEPGDPEFLQGFREWPAKAFWETVNLQKVVEKVLVDVNCPILAIHGNLDQMTPPENVEFLEMMTSTSLFYKEYLEQSGHVLPLSPEKAKLIPMILRYLNEIV